MIQGDHIHDDRIAVWTATGRLTYPEIEATMADLTLPSRTSRVLCDLTRGTVADLTTSEVEDVIKLIIRRINAIAGAKAAIVAHGSVDYGLARMFSIFSELADLPVMVKVFRTAEVAREWLASKDKA